LKRRGGTFDYITLPSFSPFPPGEDYDKFLESMYFHRILPAEIIKEMESDHTPSPAVSASYKSWGLGMAVGHYSYTNWLECWGSLPEPQPFRPECYEKSIHTSPGVFGTWKREGGREGMSYI